MARVQLKVRPRLIGLDLDGTVVDYQNEIPTATREALQACHAAGIKLAFLTGRRPRTAGMHLDKLSLPAFAATNSGCLLWEYPTWHLLTRRLFLAELVAPIAALLSPHSANFYVDSQKYDFEFFYLKREHSPVLDIYLKRWGFIAREITDIQEMEGYEITQVAMPCPDEEVRRLRDVVRAQYDSRVLALAVRWPLVDAMALELFHPDANKGSALAYFAQQLGLTAGQCLAVGDDVNDLAMIDWAGYGVAMPQAGPEVKAVADEVLDGDGPAALPAFLERILALHAADN